MKEIERKYLACVTGDHGPLTKDMSVEQGYLVAWSWVEWRLRRTDYRLPARGVVHHTAFKFGNGFVRREYEWRVPAWLFRVLKVGVPRFLLKDRVQASGWEVDTFKGDLQGLVLAEAEVDTIHCTQPPLPPGLVLLKDVTEDGGYANKRLSRLDPIDAMCVAYFARIQGYKAALGDALVLY